jgi:peptidoglycan/xylan/chitin deacetylase (PgdA/CDA1 family)
VISALAGESDLPTNAVLLTFDDGYLDHYTYVMPELVERKLDGLFFVPVSVLQRSRVMDVNKIHFIVAASSDISQVVDELCSSVEKYRDTYQLSSVDAYREEWARPGRYDDADTMFVKRMFQKGLPNPVRGKVLAELFRRFVCEDEEVFATGLYMNDEQVRTLKHCGMHIGSHGVTHRWFTELTADELKNELDASWDFLESVGEEKGQRVICYPYGGYNPEVIDIARNRNYAFGVTVESRIAMPGQDDPMLLPRLDTNDIPVAD